MNGIWTVAKREIYSFFVLPIAYVVLTVWLFYSGAVFAILAFFSGESVGGAGSGGLLGLFFGRTMLFYLGLLVFAPMLTMRLFAEERATGTLEPLLTAPINEWSIVLGKYIAGMVFWLALWVPTLLYFWIVASLGTDAVDYGVMASTYVGIFLIGVLYVAVGLLMTAVSKSQISAALLTFLVLGCLFLAGLMSHFVHGDTERAVFEYIGVWSQMSTFTKGILDTRFVVFDTSVAFLSIFATVRVLQSNRWQ